MSNYDLLIPDTPDDPPKFTFATVQQADPLRLSLDEDRNEEGDPIWLPYTPPSVVSGLSVSDRVLVLRHNGRKTASDPENFTQQGSKQLIVLGRVGGLQQVAGLSAPTAADPTVDWNDLTSPGFFPQLMLSSQPHGPTALASGYYYVQTFSYGSPPGAGSVTQVGFPYIATDPIVFRNRYSGVWADWSGSGDDRVAGVVASNTYYVKKPGGELICRGYHSFPANPNVNQTFTWSFPTPFVGELPQVLVTPDSTAPQNISVGLTGLALTSVVIQFHRTTSSATGTWYVATGRWK